MNAEDRAKLFQTLANITRDIQSLESKIADKRKDEDRIYRMLGIRNPSTKRARISPEKVALIRTQILSAMKELHDKGVGWLGMRVIVNITRRNFTGASVKEVETQIRAMAQDNVIAHNGMRGSGSAYQHIPSIQERGTEVASQ